MNRRSGKSCPSFGLSGDVVSFECGHVVVPKRGLKRSPLARKNRQRKCSRRHSALVRRATAALSRDGSKNAVLSTEAGQEDTDGSDCDEALEGCIPVLPEEVFDLVDEQTASESEEHKDTDSDATIDTEGPASRIENILCELPHGCPADLAPSTDACSHAKQNTTPSAGQQKQVIQSANVADEATAQSTVVNRPVPMPPISKPPPVAQSVSQDALLVYAPVDLTQWPIGNLPLLQGSSYNFQHCDSELKDAADCIPPPCDLPDCDDWLGIDSSLAVPSLQSEKTGRTCPLQGHERFHVSQTSQTFPMPAVSPLGLIATQSMDHQGNSGPACDFPTPTPTDSLLELTSDKFTVSPGSCVQYPVVQPSVQLEFSLPEWNAGMSCTSSLLAQSALPKQAGITGKPMVPMHGIGAEPAAPDTCVATPSTCESVLYRDVHVVQHVTAAAAPPVSIADERHATHGPSAAAGAQPMPELADSGSPAVLLGANCNGSQSTPEQGTGHRGIYEPMHWLFSPLQQSDVRGLQISPGALMPPGQAGFGQLHEQASCSWVNPAETCFQPPSVVEPTADVNSAGVSLASQGRLSDGLRGNAQPAVAGCSDRDGAGDTLQPSDQPAASLDLEDDDDLYRIFAMTCTKSPEDEESPVPSLFMDLLLNDEDENDLDWLDAEAPGADLLPTSPLHMSPDGPHAHTRLRHLGHGQTPPHSPVQPSEIQFVHSLLPGEVCIAGIDMPSHVPEFPEASGLPCHRNLNPPLELHCFHGESTAEAGTLQQPKFSHSQLRQLYAQVQAHAQLLLQSFLLASQGQISVAVARDVEKLWGWSDSLLKSGPLREEQDAVVADTWDMLTDLINTDRNISEDHPENRIPASILGAITPKDCHHDPKCILKELKDGWRPVLVQPAAPSIMHVPWLAHLDALVNACGIHVKTLPSGRAMLAKVSCDSFSQVSTDASRFSKTGTFMQPLNDDPDAAPGCRRNMRAFRSSPFTLHIQNVMSQYAIWWNRGLFPRIDGSRSSCLGSRRKAATLIDDHILATLLLHHGRNYQAIANDVPGWTEDLVRMRLRNNGRKDLMNEPRTGNSYSMEMRACIKETIQKVCRSLAAERSTCIFLLDSSLHEEGLNMRVLADWQCLRALQTLESVDGDLTPDEHMLLVPLVQDQDCLTHEFWHGVTKQHIPWRKPALLKRMWLKANKHGATGTPRPTTSWWVARSRCLLTGANHCLWAEDDGTLTAAHQEIVDLLHDRNKEYDMKMLDHATGLCAL